jgi:hypothetical protein
MMTQKDERRIEVLFIPFRGYRVLLVHLVDLLCSSGQTMSNPGMECQQLGL